MSFLAPTPPKPPSPANAPQLAKDASPFSTPLSPYGAGSLISTSPAGLRKKASTQKTSLIGGY
jgi:hypothetical protein